MSADYWAERARILAEGGSKSETDRLPAPAHAAGELVTSGAITAAPVVETKPRKSAAKRTQVEPQPAVETPADSGLNPKE